MTCNVICIYRSRMLSFQWPERRHDLDLAKEVVACHPSKSLDEEGIAARLSKKFSDEDVSGVERQRMHGEI